MSCRNHPADQIPKRGLVRDRIPRKDSTRFAVVDRHAPGQDLRGFVRQLCTPTATSERPKHIADPPDRPPSSWPRPAERAQGCSIRRRSVRARPHCRPPGRGAFPRRWSPRAMPRTRDPGRRAQHSARAPGTPRAPGRATSGHRDLRTPARHPSVRGPPGRQRVRAPDRASGHRTRRPGPRVPPRRAVPSRGIRSAPSPRSRESASQTMAPMDPAQRSSSNMLRIAAALASITQREAVQRGSLIVSSIRKRLGKLTMKYIE